MIPSSANPSDMATPSVAMPMTLAMRARIAPGAGRPLSVSPAITVLGEY